MIRSTAFHLLACSLLLGSCSDSGPTAPEAAPLVFQGTVTYLGSTWHSLRVTDYGGVRIELDDLRPRLIDVSSGLTDDLAIGFGLGQPVDDTCATTFQVSMVEGDVLSFSLGNEEYCLLMYDSGLFPEDAIVDYTLVVTQ